MRVGFTLKLSCLRMEHRSCGFLREVGVCLVLGKVAVIWMLATMESLPQAEGRKEFVKFSSVGNKTFTAQRFANKFGHFLAVAKYAGGGWRGLEVILEAKGSRDWPGFA